MHVATIFSVPALQFLHKVHEGMSQPHALRLQQCFFFLSHTISILPFEHICFINGSKRFSSLLGLVWRSKWRLFPLRISEECDFREAYLSAEALIVVWPQL